MSTDGSWALEFRRRLTWTLASDHFRHGFVASVSVDGDDGGPNPTYSGEEPGHFDIEISGTCPCGTYVRESSNGMYNSAELIRFITNEEYIAENMTRDIDPFIDYQTEGEVT